MAVDCKSNSPNPSASGSQYSKGSGIFATGACSTTKSKVTVSKQLVFTSWTLAKIVCGLLIFV